MADYPQALRDLTDAPPVLWALGDLSLLHRPMVALVGARNASSLGLRMARKLAAGLAAAGYVVVSGLARGIDAAAHEAALTAGGTVAVQAGGVDVIYPPENAALAGEIGRAGLRLSEMPPGEQPLARHFPMRNRLISGLSRAVVVVEAAARSGSLITARDALDQGREVMAVPGHPLDARAAGCNLLIREGAVLVRGVEDVLEALERQPDAGAARAAGEGPNASAKRASGPPARQVAPDASRKQDSGAQPPRGAPVGEPGVRALAGSGAARGAEPANTTTGADAGRPQRSHGDMLALPRLILDRLGPSPLAEDQLIRDLDLPAATIAPELVALELEGRIERQAGGLLSRLS
jgi:DNA processing protein